MILLAAVSNWGVESCLLYYEVLSKVVSYDVKFLSYGSVVCAVQLLPFALCFGGGRSCA